MNRSLTAWPLAALLTLSISPAWAQPQDQASSTSELPAAYRQVNELFESVGEIWRQHFSYQGFDLVDEAFAKELLGLIPYHFAQQDDQAVEASAEQIEPISEAIPANDWQAWGADYYAQDASENYQFQDAFPADKSWYENQPNYPAPPEPIDFTVVIPALADFCGQIAQLQPVDTVVASGQRGYETLGSVVQESADQLYHHWHAATLEKHERYATLYRDLDQYAGLDWECFPIDQPGTIAPSQEVIDANRTELLLGMARGLNRMGTALQQWSQHLAQLAEAQSGISSASGDHRYPVR